MISYELWERRYNSDPGIVGQSILLNSHPFTIVGVAPRGFQGTTLLRSDLWLPISMTAQAIPRNPSGSTSARPVWLVMGGRLKDGVSIEQTQSEMTAIAAGLVREFPDDYRDKGIVVARSANSCRGGRCPDVSACRRRVLVSPSIAGQSQERHAVSPSAASWPRRPWRPASPASPSRRT